MSSWSARVRDRPRLRLQQFPNITRKTLSDRRFIKPPIFPALAALSAPAYSSSGDIIDRGIISRGGESEWIGADGGNC